MFIPDPPVVDDTIKAIRAFAKKYNLSNPQLAELAGLNKNTLAGLHKPGWSPNTTTLRVLGHIMKEYPQR